MCLVIVSGLGTVLGGILGGGLGALSGEVGAQRLEGREWDDLNYKRIAGEAGLGMLPITKARSLGKLAGAGALVAGGGELMRQLDTGDPTRPEDKRGTLDPGMLGTNAALGATLGPCLLYTSPSPRDRTRSRMPSSA